MQFKLRPPKIMLPKLAFSLKLKPPRMSLPKLILAFNLKLVPPRMSLPKLSFSLKLKPPRMTLPKLAFSFKLKPPRMALPKLAFSFKLKPPRISLPKLLGAETTQTVGSSGYMVQIIYPPEGPFQPDLLLFGSFVFYVVCYKKWRRSMIKGTALLVFLLFTIASLQFTGIWAAGLIAAGVLGGAGYGCYQICRPNKRVQIGF